MSGSLTTVPPTTRDKLAVPLSAGAAQLLRTSASNPLLRPAGTPRDLRQLVDAGCFRQAIGGHVLTDVGYIRATMEIT